MNKWSHESMLLSLLLVCLCMVLLPAEGLCADDNGWARDPFAYEKKKVNIQVNAVDKIGSVNDINEPEMKIKGIFTDPKGHAVVIVDGKEYLSGDHIGSALVKSIDQFGVVLIEDGITRRIGLFGPNVEWGN